ncbi:RNA-directed DNA polymerase, eukaryota, reverse transcriptase zinc-binding domain protein [Tanacetum coccineum]
MGAFDACMNILKDKDAGVSGVSQPRMPIRVLSNPNSFEESDGTIGIRGYVTSSLDGRSDKEHAWSTVEVIGGSNNATGLNTDSVISGMAEGDGISISQSAGRFSIPHKEVTNEHVEEPIVQAATIGTKSSSYAGVASNMSSSSANSEPYKFNFTKVDNVFEGVDISMPRRVVKNVSTRYENTLYVYFIGKRISFPLEWTMITSLLKEELNHISVWIKFHDVPIEVFDEEGIIIIGSHIGKPIMLDAYTSLMFKDSWGRSSFAQCLIEVSLDEPLKESITIGIPLLDGPGFTKESIRVEYEWKPPRFRGRKRIPKTRLPKLIGRLKGEKVDFSRVRNLSIFQGLVGRVLKVMQKVCPLMMVPKSTPNQPSGSSNVQSPNVRPEVNKDLTNLSVGDKPPNKVNIPSFNANVSVSNPYEHLSKAGGEDDILDDDEVVENVYDETVNLFSSTQPRASTPAMNVNIRVNNKTLFCSFIYADNYHIDRRALWNNLASHASLMRDKPWILLGDFNATLNLEDHSCGGYEPNISMREFKECVQRMEVMDVIATEFLRLVELNLSLKFSNFLVYKEGFHDVVISGWNLNVDGCAMYKVVKRLKGLKTPLRKLLHDQGNLHDRKPVFPSQG